MLMFKTPDFSLAPRLCKQAGLDLVSARKDFDPRTLVSEDLRHFDTTVRCAAHYAGATLTISVSSSFWYSISVAHYACVVMTVVVDTLLALLAFLRRTKSVCHRSARWRASMPCCATKRSCSAAAYMCTGEPSRAKLRHHPSTSVLVQIHTRRPVKGSRQVPSTVFQHEDENRGLGEVRYDVVFEWETPTVDDCQACVQEFVSAQPR